MADSALEALKQQLKSEDVKARRKACQQLGKLNDPAAIPLLVRVYKDVTEDPKVQEAAADALKNYARKIPGAGASRTMKLIVYMLAGLLLLLVLGNVAVRLGGDEEPAAPESSSPTPRDELIATYETLLAQAEADFAVMQQEWGLPDSGNLSCNVNLDRPQPRELRQIDKDTYPDFSFVSRLNLAISKLELQVIRLYDLDCDDGSRGTVQHDIDASAALDSIEIDLQSVRDALNQAKTNPLPTIGPVITLSAEQMTLTAQAPTPLPTETPTETVQPTETATPGFVLTAPPGN